MADKTTTETAMTTTEQSVDDDPKRRACYLCGRDCAIVRKLGGLTLKEPCPNKCGAGYTKPQNARLDQMPSTEAETTERRLAHYTPPGNNYPPYLSINFRNTMVEITVRSEEQPDGSQGPTATIRMNLWHFNKIIEDAKKNLP